MVKQNFKVKAVIFIFSLCMPLFLGAQSLYEMNELFNEGAKLYSEENYEGAIKAFEGCIDMGYSVEGEEAEDLRMKAESYIPGLYYKVAVKDLKSGEYEVAIESLKKTVEVANAYGDESTANNASDQLPAVYYTLGNRYLKDNNNEEALKYYNLALEEDPNYAKVYLAMSLLYKSTDDIENLKNSIDKCIEASNASNDRRTEDKARKLGRDYFLKLGLDESQNGDLDVAINHINVSIGFEEEQPQAYYLLASLYNKKGDYDAAIDIVNKGLQFEDQDNEKRARLYYEMAKAYQSKEDTEAACEFYKKAAYGAYTEQANYQVEHILKCN